MVKISNYRLWNFTKKEMDFVDYEVRKLSWKLKKLFSIGRILGISFETVRLWILNFSQYFKPNLQEKNYDIIEVDELCTFLKNEAKNDGFGLLIIGIQGRYLVSRLEIEDAKPQKNSSQG